MQCFFKYIILIRKFHKLTQIHYCYPVRDIADRQEVMGNEQVCQSKFFFKVCQQVQYLCLH